MKHQILTLTTDQVMLPPPLLTEDEVRLIKDVCNRLRFLEEIELKRYKEMDMEEVLERNTWVDSNVIRDFIKKYL
jgi:hypothetical protein